MYNFMSQEKKTLLLEMDMLFCKLTVCRNKLLPMNSLHAQTAND